VSCTGGSRELTVPQLGGTVVGFSQDYVTSSHAIVGQQPPVVIILGGVVVDVLAGVHGDLGQPVGSARPGEIVVAAAAEAENSAHIGEEASNAGTLVRGAY